MKSLHHKALGSLGLALALAGLMATTAHAQSALTRDQVRAELAEAVRTGNILVNGESGLTLRELYPQRYPAAPTAGATRAQVIAELKEAQRTGDIIAPGDSGLRLNQLHPEAYPAQVVAAGKTRAEVQAELREALRTGNVLAGGDSDQLLKDLYPQRYANVAPMPDAPMHAATPSDTEMR
jgi:predicted RNase H-like HicB family nuclease